MLVLKSTFNELLENFKNTEADNFTINEELKAVKEELELTLEQNKTLFDKIDKLKVDVDFFEGICEDQGAVIADLKDEVEGTANMAVRTSRSGYKKLTKPQLLEEVNFLLFQVDNLNKIIDKLEEENSALLFSDEEIAELTKIKEDLDLEISLKEESLCDLEDVLAEKASDLAEKIAEETVDNAIFEAFKEQVENLPENTSGVCMVREDGEVKSLEIKSKAHAKEIVEKCENGELEFVG